MAEEIETPDKALSPTGFNHVVFNVHDMEESHHFWADLLGFTQVGELHPRPGGGSSMTMRFYSGKVNGDVNHHDLALVERPGLVPPPGQWSMFEGSSAVNHIAVNYPDRDSWLQQVRFLKKNGVKVNLRIDHGMTHSIYINDPNGYGVEVLYELPPEVWEHDIDGALNYARLLDPDDLVDTTDYETNFG
ncbi:MAG: hypothetical protein GY929_05865 [Actinomycetia bacterium]|nr:hypothetical protein [Actinomycetes bacterium]